MAAPPRCRERMSAAFDPYRVWLAVTAPERPLNHYALLGLERLESNPVRIEQAVLRQMFRIYEHLNGPEDHLARRLLDELQRADDCLTDPAAKASYDAALKSLDADESNPPRIPTMMAPEDGPLDDDSDAGPVLLIEMTSSAPLVLDAADLDLLRSPARRRRPVPEEPAAMIAQRVLQDDVKEQDRPRRTSEQVARKGRTGRRRRAASAAPQKPPALAKMPSTPLLSRSDLLQTSKSLAPAPQSPARAWSLPNLDIARAFDDLATWIWNHPRRFAVGLIVPIALWCGLHFLPKAPPASSPPSVVLAEVSWEVTRSIGEHIRVLYDPRQPLAKRSAAAQALMALPPATLHQFAATLAELVELEGDPGIRETLATIVENIARL